MSATRSLQEQSQQAQPQQAQQAQPQQGAKPLATAKSPVGTGPITIVGVLLALVVTGLGVLGLQHVLVATGLLDGVSWLHAAGRYVDGLPSAAWMLPLGVLLALLGLWVLVTALRPRPRTALSLTAQTGVFLQPRDLRRIATTTASDVDGVAHASASATRGKVSVVAEVTGDHEATKARVQAAVAERLAAVERTPTISVATKESTP